MTDGLIFWVKWMNQKSINYNQCANHLNLWVHGMNTETRGKGYYLPQMLSVSMQDIQCKISS